MKRRGRKNKRSMRQALYGLLALLLLCGMAIARATSDTADAPPSAASVGQENENLSSPPGSQEAQTGLPDETTSPPDEMEVHFLDVGQGDSILIKCASQTMLIDTAESDKGTEIQGYLTRQGIKKLDYLILTHPDTDHIGSAAAIISEFEIGRVFVSNFAKDNQAYRKMIQALDDKNLSPITPEAGSAYSLGKAEFTILAPNRIYSDPNNASIALRLQMDEIAFLFTGDAEETAENDILENGMTVKADVYKAGHHGSRSSSSEDFLAAVYPAYSVISCEEGNSYGHPHAQTLNSLRAMGVKVFRTDEQGTIVAITDGSQITWNCPPSESWIAGEPTGQ